MNQIELISEIPDWEWKDNSAYEISAADVDKLINDCDFIFRVGNAAVAGFTYFSYTSPPWMWFLLAKDVGIRDLVDFRRTATLIPQGTITGVAVDFPLGFRFAKLYGFEETKQVCAENGRNYRIMRKV